MIGEFLTATLKYTMRWKIFQWMKFLFRHSSNSRKLSRQKFDNELACVFTAHLYASKHADWNQQQLTDSGLLANRTAQIIRIVSYTIRKKSRFWLFCIWSVKEMYHVLLPKADYRDKGRGHDRRLYYFYYFVSGERMNKIAYLCMVQSA